MEKKKSFGFYTETQRRSDGRCRVRFVVPDRLRPEGWPRTRPLFLEGEDGVDLETLTPLQEAELCRQADAYYLELCKARGLAPVAKPDDLAVAPTWRELMALRRESEAWNNTSERTQQDYEYSYSRLIEVVYKHDLQIASSPQSHFERALKAEVSSLFVRNQIYQSLQALSDLAIREGKRPAHLVISARVRTPKPDIQLWTEQNVFDLVTAMLRHDEAGIAKLILAQWEIGQRMTSVRNLRYGVNYQDGWFFYNCRKTGAPIRLEVLNASARKILDRDYDHGAYMFARRSTGEPFTENQLSGRFGYVRDQTDGYEESRLKLRCLRHTVIVEFGRAGCTVPMIGSVTGHSLGHIYRTLSYYLTQDQHTAAIAMSKRERMRVDGVDGEMLVEGARRVWIGQPLKTVKPLTPRELALYGPR